MAAEADTHAKGERFDPQRLRAILDKILPAARAVDAMAQRLVGKVRTLALLGLLAAIWLTFACVDTFELGMVSALTIVTLLSIAPAVLWKIYGALRDVVGLPTRMLDTAGRIAGKTTEYRAYLQDATQLPDSPQKPTLRRLWRTGRSILEVKSLGDEAKVLVSQAGGAIVLTNPIFGFVLALASSLALLLALIAGVVALAYLF